jgi:hypothetical protein
VTHARVALWAARGESGPIDPLDLPSLRDLVRS